MFGFIRGQSDIIHSNGTKCVSDINLAKHWLFQLHCSLLVGCLHTGLMECGLYIVKGARGRAGTDNWSRYQGFRSLVRSLCFQVPETSGWGRTMGGPTLAIIIANAVLQLVGVVKGKRLYIRSFMPPVKQNQRGRGGDLMRHLDKLCSPSIPEGILQPWAMDVWIYRLQLLLKIKLEKRITECFVQVGTINR